MDLTVHNLSMKLSADNLLNLIIQLPDYPAENNEAINQIYDDLYSKILNLQSVTKYLCQSENYTKYEENVQKNVLNAPQTHNQCCDNVKYFFQTC